MGFREFITNIGYRRFLFAEFERFQNIKPPDNPSRKYIDKLVARLLKEHLVDAALRELSMMGPAVVPSVVAALQDPRYHRAQWEPYSSTATPLHATLGLLLGHADDKVLKFALPLVKSPSTEVRLTVGQYIASVGRADTMPILRELMQDTGEYVRSHVCMGIRHAVTQGRADDVFRREAYELLLSQCDQDWGDSMNEESATVIILIDPARAAMDLSDERLLSLSNRNVHHLLKACNERKILLSEKRVRQLLDEALPQATGTESYPNEYVVAEALHALAHSKAEGIGELAESLLGHENENIKIAAAETLAMLAGISDPSLYVIDREEQSGYESLSHEQRIVYCAFLFDAEVNNGGLMQFFGNRSGDHVAETLEALKALGHTEAHAALQGAITLIGPQACDPDPDTRLADLEDRWDDLEEAFSSLEDAYYASKQNLREIWLQYASRHAEHFRG